MSPSSKKAGATLCEINPFQVTRRRSKPEVVKTGQRNRYVSLTEKIKLFRFQYKHELINIL